MALGNVISFLIVGLVAGFIGGKLVEGHGYGIFGDVFVGCIGAMIGGFIPVMFGVGAASFWGSVTTSILGAVLCLLIAALLHRTLRPNGNAQNL